MPVPLLYRWNADRAADAVAMPPGPFRTFDLRLKEKIDSLSEAIHGHKVFDCPPPTRYTGELLGVEYLYNQSHIEFLPDRSSLDSQIDEGFEELDDTTANQSLFPDLVSSV